MYFIYIIMLIQLSPISENTTLQDKPFLINPRLFIAWKKNDPTVTNLITPNNIF